MYKPSGIIVLCFFAIFNQANAVENTIVSAGDATDDHVKLLTPIDFKEALPIVLFATSESISLKNPVGLSKVNINEKGRLIAGTEFYTKSSDPQIFFCPDKNPKQTEKCLVPTQFEESAELQCEIEPTPTLGIHISEVSCGPTGTSIGLKFGYKICPAQRPYSYSSDGLVLYSICYDHNSKKIIFVGNEMVGTRMLSDKLLTRERDVKFDINTETFGYIADDYMAILKAKIESKPQYNLQQLVPTDDMALANWRKATQYFANFELQHSDLIGPWNHVRSLLRTHAEKSIDRVFGTISGVFDIPRDKVPASVDENQIANFWVTLFIDFSPDSKAALAIVMNNFVAEHSSNNQNNDAETSNNNQNDLDHTKKAENNQSDRVETSELQYIDQICGEDSCVDSLKQKFRNVGGQIRCCQINQNIWSLFMSKKDILQENHILRIIGINQCCSELSITNSIPTNDCTHCLEL